MSKNNLCTRLNQAVAILSLNNVPNTHDVIAAKLRRDRTNVTKALNGNPRYLTDKFAEAFADAYSSYINKDWLLTGAGEAEATNSRKLRIHIPADKAVVAAGFTGASIASVDESECEQMPLIDFFPDYDYTIAVSGDSMEPTLHNGDIVACKWIEDTSFKRDKLYIVDSADGAVVKRLASKGNKLICSSDNEDKEIYPDFPIYKDAVNRIAVVVGRFQKMI